MDKVLTFEAVNVGGAIIDGNGGGVLFNLQADATFTGLHVRNGGYGVWQRDVNVRFNARNVILSSLVAGFVVNNSSARVGGGNIVNSTFVDVSTGILINDGGSINVTNSIFDNVNLAYLNGRGITITPDHNLLHNVTEVSVASSGGVVVTDPSQIVADPLFVNRAAGNRAAGDYRLLIGSPAVDSGKDVGMSYLGAAPDRGAFEGAFAPVTPVPEPSSLALWVVGAVAMGMVGYGSNRRKQQLG